ncbi:MAG: 4Fe-4S dicluster domain-containing protein [Desulfosarcina sp.]
MRSFSYKTERKSEPMTTEYRIDAQRCKGCALCVAVCPQGFPRIIVRDAPMA